MNIAVDRNMPLAQEAFSTLGHVTRIDGRSVTAEDLQDTQILAIRSTTKVTASLLEGTAIRFVGTATIGTDHLDIPMLEQRNIHWCYSPGCNARSVAEYVTAALLELSVRLDLPLQGKTLGVIGVGNVGSRVVKQAKALGMRVLMNDPPRQRAIPPGSPDPFVDLHTLLAQSDVVTLHVPLSRSGPDPTFHMADQNFFAAMQPHACFLNAARGPVVQTDALLAARQHNQLRAILLDTWETEPIVDPAVLRQVDIGTPHIAGHSYEGKLGGTMMVYEEACRFLACEPTFDPTLHLPPPTVPTLNANTADSIEQTLLELIRPVYDITADDKRLRAHCAKGPKTFDPLRKQYPIRREFRFTTVDTQALPRDLAHMVSDIGFTIHS